MKQSLSSAFYSLQILHQHNQYPQIYWIIYLLSLLQLFFNLHLNSISILFEISHKIASPQSIISQSTVFAYLIISITLQFIGLILLCYLSRHSNIIKSNIIDIFLKLLFWLSFVNYTLNLGFIHGFQNSNFKISAIILYSIMYILNIILFNFTLSAKRVWGINQMLMLDVLKILLLWTNGSKVLIILCLSGYLLVSIPEIVLRPVFHLSSQNKYFQLIISFSLYFSVLTLTKICTQSNSLDNIVIQILISCLFIYLVKELIKKWLDYKISKLYIEQQNQKELNLPKHSVNELILLQFMQQNFDEYENVIKLYLLNHVRRCHMNIKCPCNKATQCMLKLDNQIIQQNSTSIKTQVIQNNSQVYLLSNKKNQKNILQSKTLFSDFTLIIFNKFLDNELDFSVKNQFEKNFKQTKKQLNSLQQRSILKQCLILQYIKLQKLITTSLNLNMAYFQLKSLQNTLKKHHILSIQQSGILTYLKHEIVKKKHITMQTDMQHTNKFCLKFFNCQKITNKLEDLIMKSVKQMRDFWLQIKIRQPDERKLLTIMSRFNKYHDKIMKIYNQVQKQKQKQNVEIRMMFKFYEKILQLEGQYRFFKGSPIIQQKQNNIKNAVSLNLKLYSQQSTTHVMSFSINQETFGQLKYASSGTTTIIDQNFTTLNSFIPKECNDFHTKQMKNFLSTDYNYFQHTLVNPCYIKCKQNIIKPVYLQTHLMVFLMIGEIQLITFFKPLIQDDKLIKKGACRNFDNIIQQNVVVCCNDTGNMIGWTNSFQLQKDRMFENLPVQQIITQNLIIEIKQKSIVKLQLSDSDYDVSLIKKMSTSNSQDISHEEQYLYFILFQNIIQKQIYKQQQQQRKQQKNTNTLTSLTSKKRKPKKQFLKNLLIKTIDNQLSEVQKFDQIKDKINHIWDTTSNPLKNNFKQKWTTYTIFFLVVFAGFIAATTYYMHQRKDQFKKFNNFLNDFANNQVATVQAITYLRQININLYTKITTKIALIPTIIQQVDRLNDIMYNSLMKLSIYMTDYWKCLDVLDYGPRILRQQKAYIVVTNFVLNTVTNLIDNVRQNINSLNFSPIQSNVRVPYNQPQSNFLKLINNGVSFVIPSQIQLRQVTLKNIFLPNLNAITNKAFFLVPIAGLGVCLSLLIYFICMKRRLDKLTLSSFGIFQKIKVEFVNKKIANIQKNMQSVRNNEINSSHSLTKSKKIAWKNLSNLFEKTSTLAFGTFTGNTINSNNNIKNQQQKKIISKLSTLDINLPQTPINQQTQRQLYDESDISSNRVPDKSFNSQINDAIKQEKNQANQSNNKEKDPQSKLEFNKQKVTEKNTCQHFQFCWIVLPLIFYFMHTFLITIQFNQFMNSILRLQNQMLYRKESIAYCWNYQYEIGLFEGYFSLSDQILLGIDQTYKSQQKLSLWEQETSKFIFGNLQNYKKAKSIFMYGNVCNNLDLLQSPQPSFNSNYSKQECESVYDGSLKNGYRQTFVSYLQAMRSLFIDNKLPQFYPPIKRMMTLNDTRIINYNKLAPYMMVVTEYIDKAFQKDFDYFISLYEVFVLIDTPLMIIICFSCIFVYIRKRKLQMRKQVAMIKCCFLLIGHQTFLKDPTLLKDQDTQNQGDRYHFLQ